MWVLGCQLYFHGKNYLSFRDYVLYVLASKLPLFYKMMAMVDKFLMFLFGKIMALQMPFGNFINVSGP